MTRAVGVDLGGTNGRAALVDVERGELLEVDAKLPVTDRSPEAVAELVGALVDRVDPKGERAGVGIGFAGMLRGYTGVVVNAPNFGWREVDFRTLLRKRVGAATELYNDLNAIAYGETRFGCARGVRDVFFCFVGTGVGAGIVTDGRLYAGSNHLAGEFGHTKVIYNGRLCGCGQRGCLEAYTSGANLQARAREDLAKTTSLAVELAGSLENLHAGHLEEAAARGDRYACELLEHAGSLLGIALANAVTTLNPSRLIMGGGVWEKSPELRKHTSRYFRETVNPPALEGFEVVDSTLGERAGVLGAAALIAGK
jgi:glucokinase